MEKILKSNCILQAVPGSRVSNRPRENSADDLPRYGQNNWFSAAQYAEKGKIRKAKFMINLCRNVLAARLTTVTAVRV